MKFILTIFFVLCVHRASAVESETNTQGMELVNIPAGTFRMGAERDPEWQTKGLDAYTALSYDDGKTWQKLKPLSAGGPPKPLTSVRDREWTMDAVHGTPAGYFSGAQSPDGNIHLADSRYYQRLNLARLEQSIPAATAEEKASEARTEQQIQEKGSLGIPARGKGARLDFDAGKKGK